MIKVTELLKNEYVRYILAGLLGITVGVVFYPSKNIEQKLETYYNQIIESNKQFYQKEITTLQEQLNTVKFESKTLHEEDYRKISKLTSEVKDLQSKQKTAYYKLIKPDGTIEIRKFSESEVTESTKKVTEIQEEYQKKIDQLENKWESIHKERVSKIQKEFDQKEENYKKTISKLESSKTVSTNSKKFGIEAGYLLDKSYYGHATMNLWGPIFLGVHGNIKQDNTALGLGLGVSF